MRSSEQKVGITVEYINRLIYWVERLNGRELSMLMTVIAELARIEGETDATSAFLKSTAEFAKKNLDYKKLEW